MFPAALPVVPLARLAESDPVRELQDVKVRRGKRANAFSTDSQFVLALVRGFVAIVLNLPLVVGLLFGSLAATDPVGGVFGVGPTPPHFARRADDLMRHAQPQRPGNRTLTSSRRPDARSGASCSEKTPPTGIHRRRSVTTPEHPLLSGDRRGQAGTLRLGP